MAFIKKYSHFLNESAEFTGIKIGENTFAMEVSSNHSKGLMGRNIQKDGMIFNFPTPRKLSFHTQKCIQKLDIVYVLENKIVKIFTNCPKNAGTNFECDKADTVLEFLGGTCKKLGIQIGNFVSY